MKAALARAVSVQIARDGLTPAAGFAGDQHPAVVLRDPFDLLAQAHHRLAVAHRIHLLFTAAAQADVLLGQAVGLQGALHGQQQLGQGQRLLQKIVGTQTGRLHCGLDRAVTRHHDHRAGQVAGGRPLLEQADVGEAVLGRRHLVALVGKNLADQLANIRLVIDYQYKRRTHALPSSTLLLRCLACTSAVRNGSETTMRAPPSARFSARILPPCSPTIRFTIARPSPVPFCLVVT